MRRMLLGSCLTIALLAMSGAVNAPPAQPSGTLALQPPAFLAQVGTAHAQEAPAGVGIATVQNEAGIAAYFDRGASINLAQVRGLFRTIEVDNGSYILGSMQATGTNNYAESEDPHVYVGANGWVMAYYLNSDPGAKIIDLANYSGSTINTKLEIVLGRVGTAIGIGSGFAPSFYDFRYPNATRMLLVADSAPNNTSDSFQVSLPGGFSYYERSWTLNSAVCGAIFLNGVKIVNQTCGIATQRSGYLTSAQLQVDTTHLVDVRYDGGCCGTTTGAIAIVYRDVP